MKLMNINIDQNIKSSKQLLSEEMYQQQQRLYEAIGVKEKYSEPLPNNYSFVFYKKQEFTEKTKETTELYKPLNLLNKSLFDYYSSLSIKNFDTKKLNDIKIILYHWGELIQQGNFFLTWKLFIKLDEIINESQNTKAKKNKQKYFVELSKSLPDELLNEWEIGLAISQYELKHTLSLIIAKLKEYTIEPKRIEVSKIFKESDPHPSFPTIKLHFYSSCCQQELIKLCFDLINTIKNNSLTTGDITQSFGENYDIFLRMQNGFEGLKRILQQMNVIDYFYYKKHDYAYRKNSNK